MHSVKYVGSLLCVVFGPGLWAMQPEVVHYGSPFPAFNLLCQLWRNEKLIFTPLLISIILKEQFVLAVSCFRVYFAPLTLLLPKPLQFVWLVGGC